MRPTLPLFGLGLALGGTLFWLPPRHAPIASAPAPRSPGPIVLPAWDWRAAGMPAPLSPSSASTAIAAWLASPETTGANTQPSSRTETLRALLARLPGAELPRLLVPLSTRDTHKNRQLLQIVFGSWVEQDPAAAARWAGTAPDAPGFSPLNFALQASREWAKLDPDAAIVWACAVPDQERALMLVRRLLPPLAARDPTRALALVSARGAAFRDQLLPTLVKPLAKAAPAAALQTYGAGLWNKGDGFYKLREPLSAWARQDPSAALAWILAHPSRRTEDLPRWIDDLVQDGADRRALADTLAASPDLRRRQAVLSQLLFSWGADDPQAALAWLDSFADPNLRTVLLERAAQITYAKQGERSLPLALAMPEGAGRNARLGELLGQWAERDPSAALAWIREHDEPGVAVATSSAHASILGTIARDEPATALAEWEKLPSGATKIAALVPIAQAWAQTNPAAAFQWITEQEAARGIRTTHEGLLHSWAQRDPLAALRWAEQSRPDDQRTYLLAIGATWNDKAPRATTADLYTKIKDPKLRAETLTTHVREWLTKDPAAAKAWLEKPSALTPAQAAALLSP